MATNSNASVSSFDHLEEHGKRDGWTLLVLSDAPKAAAQRVYVGNLRSLPLTSLSHRLSGNVPFFVFSPLPGVSLPSHIHSYLLTRGKNTLSHLLNRHKTDRPTQGGSGRSISENGSSNIQHPAPHGFREMLVFFIAYVARMRFAEGLLVAFCRVLGRGKHRTLMANAGR
ncbi:hypothetical protein MTO96_023512 [Rhipicephalus appendiculatus]